MPVQVTAEGKVVAVGDGPQGDYLPITGGELLGDLEVDGGISAAGDVVTGNNPVSGSSNGALQTANGQFWASTATGAYLFTGYLSGNSTPKVRIKSNGSAEFASGKAIITSGGSYIADLEGNAAGNAAVTINSNGSASFSGIVDNTAGFVSDRSSGAGGCFLGRLNGNGTSQILANGSATFDGDVVIGSRGAKWLIRESNGVAMLIEQTRRGQIEPRMQKVRDLPSELDLIETALSEVMAKLKMVPPAGWPVWDGQDEVTSDNDNA